MSRSDFSSNTKTLIRTYPYQSPGHMVNSHQINYYPLLSEKRFLKYDQHRAKPRHHRQYEYSSKSLMLMELAFAQSRLVTAKAQPHTL